MSTFADGWFGYATSMLWQSSLLMVVVWLGYLLCRRRSPALRYALLCLVLVKFLLPPGLHSVTGLGHWVGRMKQEQALPAELPLNPAAFDFEMAELPAAGMPAVPVDVALNAAEPAFQIVAETNPMPAPTPRAPIAWPQLLFRIWFSVCGFLFAALILHAVRMYRRFRAAVVVQTPAVNEMLADCRARLGVRQRVRLFALAGLASPVLVGLVRPRILISTDNLAELDAAALRPILLHELAHVKRRDLWVNLLQVVLQVLWFFHPGLWLTNWLLRREREKACDDVVLAQLDGQGRAYAESILAVLRQATRSPLATVGLVGIAENNSALKGRLKRILRAKGRIAARVGVLGGIALLALAAVLLPMAEGKPAEEERNHGSSEQSVAEERENREWTRIDANGRSTTDLPTVSATQLLQAGHTDHTDGEGKIGEGTAVVSGKTRSGNLAVADDVYAVHEVHAVLLECAGTAGHPASPLLEHTFVLDHPVPLELTTEVGSVMKNARILFSRDATTLYGMLKYHRDDAPRRTCRLICELVDANGGLVGKSTNVVFRIPGPTGYSHSTCHVPFPIGPWREIKEVTRFRFRLEREQNTPVAPPAALQLDSIPHVSLLDEHGRHLKADYTTVLWQRAYPDQQQWHELGECEFLPGRHHRKTNLWHDRETDMLWFPYSSPGGRPPPFHDLLPGEYLMTAFRTPRNSNDPTPWGRSDVIRVGRSKPVRIKMTSNASVVFQFEDADSRAPLGGVDCRLTHESGLPVFAGWVRSDAQGLLPLRRFRSGEYRLEVRKRATCHGEAEYRRTKDTLIDVLRGKNARMVIPLQLVMLTPVEIDKRWPCIVEGIVKDEQGKPLEGVRVDARTGMGTLWGRGTAITEPDGRYRLRFGPGVRTPRSDSAIGSWPLQHANIFAAKAGLREQNDNRHGRLMMAPDVETARAGLWGQKGMTESQIRSGVVLAGEPYRLSFVMAQGKSAALARGWKYVAAANERTVAEMLSRPARGVMDVEHTYITGSISCSRISFLRGAQSELRWRWESLGTKNYAYHPPDHVRRMTRRQYLRHPDAALEAVECSGTPGWVPPPTLYIREPGWQMGSHRAFVLERWLRIGPRHEWSLKAALERDPDSVEVHNNPEDPEAPWTFIIQEFPTGHHSAQVTVDPRFAFLITRYRVVETESGRVISDSTFTYELRKRRPPFCKLLEKKTLTVRGAKGELSLQFAVTTQDFEWLTETDPAEFEPMNLFSENVKTVTVCDERAQTALRREVERSAINALLSPPEGPENAGRNAKQGGAASQRLDPDAAGRVAPDAPVTKVFFIVARTGWAIMLPEGLCAKVDTLEPGGGFDRLIEKKIELVRARSGAKEGEVVPMILVQDEGGIPIKDKLRQLLKRRNLKPSAGVISEYVRTDREHLLDQARRLWVEDEIIDVPIGPDLANLPNLFLLDKFNMPRALKTQSTLPSAAKAGGASVQDLPRVRRNPIAEVLRVRKVSQARTE